MISLGLYIPLQNKNFSELSLLLFLYIKKPSKYSSPSHKELAQRLASLKKQFKIEMENQLNYYSRYNRRKVEEKKQIPSLYSLLSLQTLTKLAHDATVSLQMISHYKKEKAYRSMVGDQETQESEYLQANNLFTFRSSESQSVDRKKNSNKKNKSSVHVVKKKTKLNEAEQQQKVSKQAYLQNLVRQVRSKSIERLQTNSLPKQSSKRQKKHQKKKVISSKLKTQQQSTFFQTLNDNLNDSHDDQTQVQDKESKQPQVIGKMIQKKLIKSLVCEQVQSIQQSCQKEKAQYQSKEIRRQYVESIDDGNEKEMSGPSIVLERMNFKVQERNQLQFKAQNKLKEKADNKVYDFQSKQDNPSDNDVKQSEIKSFSKKLEELKKPFKNLIEIQLNHSQSQIWKPEERSLQISQRQFQQEKILIHQANQNKSMEKIMISEQIQQNCMIPDLNKEKVEIDIIKMEKVVQIFSGIHEIDHQNKANFLSQINVQKLIQDPPYQHPLQTINYQNQFAKPQIAEQEIIFTVPSKKPFKKFFFNKELNPRLVTSTILNERNQMNFNLQKEKPKHEGDQNKNEKLDSSIQIVQEKSEKVNFKALMRKKKQNAKQENPSIEKLEKQIPLRKLQNRKLLQAFFNNN